ncbi:hypothetical protein GNP81_06300 [Aliivibrio fischeri]|uniref:hypothetical protein n=1 Tax=Aliivibrio fischeri TaxID=668 RepID=UPI0012D948C1|nr:hypothetical protein [Aliivibrio fischeri]MUK62940.1 hypothetical protein [Aliivibrio fischeri]MUL20443.1 hypothetical protein [Aliivibrio fischeri]MUL24218.1 hypothetical protein [Aliivibrio fischeri]
MAVEKLTGPRLFQLIFLLFVLIAAFTWRTITYVPESGLTSNSELSTACDMTEQACLINIDNNQFIIDVASRPIQQNAEMIVNIKGEDIALNLQAKGADMNMGILKFTKELKGGDVASYSTFVPKCKHNEMKWLVMITADGKNEEIIFTAKK